MQSPRSEPIGDLEKEEERKEREVRGSGRRQEGRKKSCNQVVKQRQQGGDTS